MRLIPHSFGVWSGAGSGAVGAWLVEAGCAGAGAGGAGLGRIRRRLNCIGGSLAPSIFLKATAKTLVAVIVGGGAHLGSAASSAAPGASAASSTASIFLMSMVCVCINAER